MICVATAALDSERALVRLARLIAGTGDLTLASAIRIGADEAVELVQPRVRARRRALDRFEPSAVRSIVTASPEPWAGLREALRRERPDLMLAAWDAWCAALEVEPESLIQDPPCDLALVRGEVDTARRILVPLRGGRYAELAVRLAMSLARANGARVTLLHVAPEEAEGPDAGRGGLDLYRLIGTGELDDEIARVVVRHGDPERIIVEEAASHDAVFVGATGLAGADLLGPIGRALLAGPTPIVLLRTRVPVASSLPAIAPLPAGREERGHALRALVDRWFVENTFASTEFADVRRLLERKARLGLTISVALPALNEEATIGKVIRAIRSHLMERVPLIDELVVIDSRSRDGTREVAREAGVPVFIHDEILPECGTHVGKGEAMWKSLHVTSGDLVVWVDTDVSNFHPKFVYGILGPLLARPEIGFVKAFYRRPLQVGDTLTADGGGRVTELAARPILNLLYPELSGMVQPLSGEQGGRRALLERLPFFTGYGVETGLLIDVLRRGGLRALAQVDMRARMHRNRSLEELSLTSFEILQVALKRVGSSVWEEANSSMKQISVGPDGDLRLVLREIPATERPPLTTIPGYVANRRST